MEKVFIIGGTTYDHITTLNEFPPPLPQTIHQAQFHEGVGSTGSGKAIALNKLGVPCSLYSVLGDDSFGKVIIDKMETEGLDFLYDIDPKGTERHFNIMNKEGQRISIFITQSSVQLDFSYNRIEQEINNSDLIVLNILEYCKSFIPLVKASGKPIWTDLHDYTDNNPYHEEFIEVADVIFLSSDNLRDYKSTMRSLMAGGKKMVVCTHGQGGSSLLTNDGQWIDQAALEDIDIVDTNGAGDNYFSGFLYSYLKQTPLKTSMQTGSICGALSITSKDLVASNLSPEYIESKDNWIFT